MTHLIINLISGQISSSLSPPLSFGSAAPRDALRTPWPRRPQGLVTKRFSPIYQLIGKIGLPILGVCWHFLVASRRHAPPKIKIPRSGHVLQETQTPQGLVAPGVLSSAARQQDKVQKNPTEQTK